MEKGNRKIGQPRWRRGLAGCDPGYPESSPTWGSLHGACFSLCLCLCLSLSLSLSLSHEYINKILKKKKKEPKKQMATRKC